jgi:hypothetical protein
MGEADRARDGSLLLAVGCEQLGGTQQEPLRLLLWRRGPQQRQGHDRRRKLETGAETARYSEPGDPQLAVQGGLQVGAPLPARPRPHGAGALADQKLSPASDCGLALLDKQRTGASAAPDGPFATVSGRGSALSGHGAFGSEVW